MNFGLGSVRMLQQKHQVIHSLSMPLRRRSLQQWYRQLRRFHNANAVDQADSKCGAGPSAAPVHRILNDRYRLGHIFLASEPIQEAPGSLISHAQSPQISSASQHLSCTALHSPRGHEAALENATAGASVGVIQRTRGVG
jgi:hypothetical protein